MRCFRLGIVVASFIFVAGCSSPSADEDTSSAAVVAAPDALACVEQAWRVVEKQADVDLGGGQGLLGFLAPRPATVKELHPFLVERSREIFGEGLGDLLAHVEVRSEGGPELVAQFTGFGIGDGYLGEDSKRAFEAVRAALAHVEVEHAWYLHGRSPASGSDYLVIRDRSGMMWGFFVGIVG